MGNQRRSPYSTFGRLAGVSAAALVLVIGACSADETAQEAASGTETSESEATAPAEKKSKGALKDRATTKKQKPNRPTGRPSPTQRALKVAKTFLVSRVIDGDTIELGNGQTVRLVGIDTPERGECGFDQATNNLINLVAGKNVRLTRSDENTDRYGRLLRYVDIGNMDAGLRLIKNGRAIARYDSRDGYGFHPREPRYIAADRASPQQKCAQPKPQTPAGNCEPGYDPCVPPYPPDVNCADVNGPIRVTGSDPHGLDADGDGVACE